MDSIQWIHDPQHHLVFSSFHMMDHRKRSSLYPWIWGGFNQNLTRMEHFDNFVGWLAWKILTLKLKNWPVSACWWGALLTVNRRHRLHIIWKGIINWFIQSKEHYSGCNVTDSCDSKTRDCFELTLHHFRNAGPFLHFLFLSLCSGYT